jgi:hypothetical protein
MLRTTRTLLATCLLISMAVAIQAETLTVTLTAPVPVVKQTPNGSRITIAGFGSHTTPGQPRLPSQVFRIAVPPDIDWNTLKLRSTQGQPQALTLPAPVAPGVPDQAGAPGGASAGYPKSANIVNGKNMAVYGQATLIPAAPIRLMPYAQMRKWKFAQVRFSPVQWNPSTGEAQFYPTMQVELEFDRLVPQAGTSAAADDPALADNQMDDVAAEMLVNYNQATSWYTPSETAKAAVRKSFTADYVIITTTAITNGCSRLQDFITHKTIMGYSVAVVTEGQINSVTGVFPNGRADKIRKWLQDHYISWGIQWVLLIGDPTPSDSLTGLGGGDIPMKFTWPRIHEDDNYESPTDMYYSDILGNWNISGDFFAGEPEDLSPLGVTLVPSLYVGRIPVYNADYTTLSNVLQKIMDYDNDVNQGWRKSTLLPMSYSASGYDGAPLAEQMWDDYLHGGGYSRYRMYEQGNGPCGDDSDYASDQELRGGNRVRDRWAAHPAGIVCWWGHGNWDNAAVGYGDDCWDGPLFNIDMTSSLDDRHPAFTYQNSCLNGRPDVSQNLQYRLLVEGCIGTVGATRDSWFNTGDDYGDFNTTCMNSGIAYNYCRYLAAGNRAGKALARGKLAVVGDIGDDADGLMNQFDFNLYGDPTSEINYVMDYYPLDDNTPWLMNSVPRRYSFGVHNSSWAGVGIRPATADHNIRVDTQVGLPSPYAASAMTGVTPDFVVANGFKFGNGTHYAEVYSGDESRYAIEAENGSHEVGLETWGSRYFRADEVIDLVQVAVTAGHTYKIEANLINYMDLMLFAFDPSRTWGTRQNYDAYNHSGAGYNNTLTYTVSASGYMGLLVVKADGYKGNYNLRVSDVSPLAAPASCAASDGTAADRVSVSWSSVVGASYYRVYRNTSNDSASATALSGWIAGTSYDDLTAEMGNQCFYWIKAAMDKNGYRASAYSVADPGYVQPPTLTNDVPVHATNSPSYYQFSEPANYWVAVGIRADNPADNWNLRLYSAPDFATLLSASSFNTTVDFVVVDRNHAPNVLRGIEADQVTGTNGATVEFDGGSETLRIGANAGLAWPAGEVVKMRDLSLTNGSYRFALTVTAGTANLDYALFGSGNGNYYRNREQYLARSALRRSGAPAVFYVSATNDWYGVCVWGNDTNSATYSIEVLPVTAGLWDGKISEDWHTPGNWDNNAVPVASTDVTIPPGTPFSPRIYRQLAYCSNITVQAGAMLTINTNELYAGTDAHIHGNLNMNSTLARFHLGGDMYWEAGSTATMLASARILVTGDWNFEQDANVQLTDGYVEFQGAGISTIRCYEDRCNLYNLACSKYTPDYLDVSALSVADLPINNLYIYSGTAFYCHSAHNVIIRGFMNNMGGTFQWPSGGAVFTGNPSVAPLNPTANCYFNDLVQSGTGPLVLGSAFTNYLRVAGDVTILSNALDCAGLGLWVGGNWTNAVGRAGFLCRTGAVTFTGFFSQSVYGSNVFNTVWDNRGFGFRGSTLWLNDDIIVSNAHHVATLHGVKGRLNVLGTLDLNSPSSGFAVYTGGDVSTAHFDQGGHLYMYGGQFLASDLTESGVFGRYTINNGTATLQQDAAQFVDLNGIVDISNGTLRVVGGSGVADWPWATNASLTMSGGVLDYDGAGIRVNYSATYKLTNNITGGRIRTSGDLICPDATFNPPGGEFEFYGAVNRAMNLASGAGLHSLIVSKMAATLTASANVVLSGDFTLQSGVFNAPPLLTLAGSWANNVGLGAFVAGAGTVVFNGATAASILTDEAFCNLSLNKTYPDFDALQLAGGIRVNVSSNLTGVDGALEMDPASVLNVRGDLTLARGAGLNASAASTAIFIGGNWVNQNTNHTIYNGFEPGVASRVTFDGTRTATLSTACPAEEFQDLVVDRLGGALRPASSIYVNGQLSVNNGYWSSVAAGLQHHLQGDVYVNTTGAWGDSAPANTVWFTGGNDATITYAGTNGYFPNITINKTGGAHVRLMSDLLQLGGVGLNVAQGSYDLNGHLDRLTAGATVASNAVLTVSAGSELDLGGGTSLTVQPGGRLEVLGAAGKPAKLSRQSGNYSVLVQSNATIAAQQAIFEYLDATGVYVMNGAIVDPTATFNDCTFRYGLSGGSLLRVENNQALTVVRAVFPSNAGAGSANVSKSQNRGHLTFRDASGVFAGATYEADPFNLIDWSQGVLTSVALNLPGYVTLGGRYDATATVMPTNAAESITYFWSASENAAIQHLGGVTPDKARLSWNTAGSKLVRVVVSNLWGTMTATQAVLVQPLRIAEIRQPSAGTNLFRLLIEGTTHASHYEIQCTTNLNGPAWTTVMPHGSSWLGSDTNSTWVDYSTADRPLESMTNLFYRIKVLPPNDAAGEAQ